MTTNAEPAEPSPNEPTSLLDLGLLFLRLGATAFGGPAAHIAMMRDEVVVRRGWLSDERFLDLLGVTNLIPGPNSTEMAIHIGWSRRRAPGLIVAGCAFILPAAFLTALLGWAYVRFGSRPSARFILYGIKPVILGIVVQAIAGLTPRAARTNWLRLLGVIAALLAFGGVNEIAILLGAGLVAAAARSRRGGDGGVALRKVPAFAPLALGVATPSAVTLPGLFGVFVKIGSVLFGSGYVLLAFLRADLVERRGWLTEAQLIDAVAVGQVTPGPVFTTATFIGYLLAGPRGALVATVGIFLPAFVFVALSGPLVRKIRSSPAPAAFLDGVNVASLALMAVVTCELARAALVDVPTLALALVSAFVLIRFKPNATWLVLGGAAAGWLVHVTGIRT
jgi:chromate transporter